jgi:hypothetical protein
METETTASVLAVIAIVLNIDIRIKLTGKRAIFQQAD